MDIPDLVKGALGDEEIQAGVSLGDEDAVCLTPTRTLVYSGEGLISDEQVEEYSHDVEQLAVSEGRRKTKFTMQYIDGTRSFTVPANRGEKVLKLFLEGILRLEGVIEQRESLAGVYRFSELTLIITEGRLIKHIGSQVWTEDYEMYPYEDVTGLEFERASVATSIALSVDGRPQRVKVPNDKAPVVRQTLEQALFGYYDVASIDELNRLVSADDETAGGGVEQSGADDDGDDFAFGDDFDPLVSDDADDLTEPVDADDALARDTSADTVDTPSSGERAGQSGTQNPGTASDQPADAPTGQSTEQSSTPDRTTPADPGQSPEATADARAEPERESPGTAGTETPQTDGQTNEQTTETRQTDVQPAEGGASDATQTASGSSPSQGTQRSEAPAEQSAPSGGSDAAETSPDTAGERSVESTRSTGTSAGATGEPGAGGDAGEPAPVTREEFEAMAERLEELTDAVDRQNELLKRQHRALKQLVQRRDSE
ncbi:DUF7115 domain-containing protein [Halosimplex salinum]|uniref:DUF7115 domain-containing protein n=1 Tax=Halosimplex salinum TaxID=1710538 RepID=UPI000F487863|nr:hypothetical protein [Halosimplex salinum]